MSIVAVIVGDLPETDGRLRFLGWPVAIRPEGAGGAVMVRSSFDQDALRQCLSAPWIGGIELSGDDRRPTIGSCFRRHLAEGGLGLSLRSDTAYGGDIGLAFAEALASRLVEADDDDFDLAFVIQEMLSNALLHGNLEVGGIDSPDGGGLEGYGERLDAALADPERAARKVQLSASLVADRLEIAVEDDGPGFDPSEPHPASRRPHGLSILEGMVAELRIEEGGRRAVASLSVPARRRRPEPLGLGNVRVLVVDDNQMNRVLMETLLVRMGVGRIESVESGEKGLAAVEREKPDLILLDVMMPGMDGFEMCRRLRRLHPLTELPVIFVTALDGPADRTACFAAGGSDMVTKPVNPDEVAARVGVHLRLGQAMDRLKAYQDRVYDELRAARGAQAALMPTSAELAGIRRNLGLVVDGRIETSSELGGDFWTVFPAGRNQLFLVVADFTGHGPVAAFNVFRLHLLLSRLPRRIPSPSVLLGHLNLELKAVLRPGQFAGAFAALIDVEANTLTFSAAAAPPAVLLTGGEARLLEADGAPLGAFADAEYDEITVGMPPGAALLVYSDALVESLDGDGRPVCDTDILRQWVLAAAADHSLADEVLARFRERLPGEPPDDLTLVSIRQPSAAVNGRRLS